ncbi:MAG: HAMP domain-containing histidine kinase [Oscillospiraceae bacterium]|nr:HAMP domain-containing histidine kinase [Oscillospiraceae bacterium]
MRNKLRIRLSQTPLQAEILLCFVIFTLIFAGILFVMQIVLPARIYKNNTIRETQQLASDLYETFAARDVLAFKQEIDRASLDNHVCISVYKENGRFVYNTCVLNYHCLLHGGNSLVREFSEELRKSDDGSISMTVYDEDLQMDMLVIGIMLGSPENPDGYLFLNAALEQSGANTRAQKQLIIIASLILMIIGFIISFIVSRLLSVPITRITESANRMAKGDYETKFEGGSCLEVDELAKSLTYAEHEISKADMMQRDLIANVSHDLRTPLTMLKAYAEMIRDLSGDNPVKREAHLKIIIDETDRLAALVNDILDLSKLENGTQKLEIQQIDVTAWLSDIIQRYKGVSEQMGYHISFTPDTTCTVECDSAKMERVICNLINNAINYTGDDKQVFVSQVNTESAVRIEVRDTGQGIEEDKIQKIFDKYYRSENHKREVVGTGLGLSIVKAILKLHNCSFGVHSRLGEGSVFWFELPKV